MDDPEKSPLRWGRRHVAVAVAVAVLLALLAAALWRLVLLRMDQAATLRNARSIGGLLHSWAAENGGIFPDALDYPEGKTANRVLRRLFQDEVWQEERTFGALRSPFQPDGETGYPPGHERALEPNENHWMIFGGQSNSSARNQIAVFENSVDATWPPWWKRAGEVPVRGRAWPGRKIAVCLNDVSVLMVTLEEKGGKLILPQSILVPNPKLPAPRPSVLDIETR